MGFLYPWNFTLGFKHRIYKYVAPLTAILQSIILGAIGGWPVLHISILLSEDSPVKMTKDEVSCMMAMSFFGNMISPIPIGYLMDRFGRQKLLLYTSFLPVVTWLFVGLGREPYQLQLGWFLAGIWMGCVYTITPVYIGEITDQNYRGFVNAITSVFRRSGVVLQFVLTFYFPYRWVGLLMCVIPLVSLFILIWTPESPYFYVMKNDKESAIEALYKLRGKSSKNNSGLNSVTKEIADVEMCVSEEMKNRVGFLELFTNRSTRKVLIIMETIIVLIRISDSGCVIGYITTTLPKHVFNLLDPIQCVVIIEIIKFITGFISSMFIDKIGRKPLMAGSSLICGIAMLILSVWYFVDMKTPYDVSYLNWIPFVCLVFHNTAHCIGLGPVMASLRSEYFAMNIKAKSNAITSSTVAVVSCIISKTFLKSADNYGIYFNYLVFSISCFLNAVFTLMFVIETKGKSLKQIQDDLNFSEKKRKSSSNA